MSESRDGVAVGNADKMVMKFPMLGKELRGFFIAPGSGNYGVLKMEMDPKHLSEMLSESFSFTKRYLGFIPITIFYAERVPTDARVTVQGVLPKDKIKGDVIIFGREDDLPTDLDDLAIDTIRSNLELYRTGDNKSYVQLRNVSLKKSYSDMHDDI